MGNQSSSSKRIGYPNQQLKLKVNDKLDPIPCPYAVSKPNYQSLHNDPQFKDFLMENLYSNPFISSILQNSFDESIVMEGIPYFMAINREVRTDYNNDVKKFQDFIISGLQVIFNLIPINSDSVLFRQRCKFARKILSFTKILVALRFFELYNVD